MMNRRHKFTLSIHFRLSAIFLGVMVVLVLINIYIYMNVNHVVDNINQVYEKNFKLNELQEELQNIQLCMTEYLENKNTDSMENYYRHVQEYEHILTDLNSETVGDDYFLMEKNILNLSYSYISLTDAGIEYKRGREDRKSVV